MVSPSKPAIQQLPPWICTVPVKGTDAVGDISMGMKAVGVSEEIGGVSWLGSSVDAKRVGVRVAAGGTRLGGRVRLAA
jgi:hypothetical protein